MQKSTAVTVLPGEGGQEGPTADHAARLRAANINPDSFLATDYLNHFNEAIMLLELVPDLPEMLAEAKQWQPKSYTAHFMDSDFAAKELACQAYEEAPARFRIPFDLTRRALDRKISEAIAAAGRFLEAGDDATFRLGLEGRFRAIRDLISTAGGIINGSESRPLEMVPAIGSCQEPTPVMVQEDIDAMFGNSAEALDGEPEALGTDSAAAPSSPEEPESDLSQDEIDALFD